MIDARTVRIATALVRMGTVWSVCSSSALSPSYLI